MDFGAIISRAIKITWEHKILWLLGFLVALGSGGSSSVSNPQFSNRFSSGDMPWVQDLVSNPGIILAAISALICILGIISIVIWVVGLIAKGGLIAGVQQIETDGKTTFRSAWGVGANRFWRMLGLNLLISIPIIIIIVAVVLVFGGSIAAMAVGAGATRGGRDEVMAGAVIGVIAVVCCLICVIAILGIIAAALQVFGERAIVVENLGVMDSIRRAWRVFRANLGNIILLALVMGVISGIFGLVVGAVAAIVLLPTLFPVISEVMGSGTVTTASTILAVVGFLVAMVLGAIVNTLFITFNSAAWTLAYRHFINQPVTPAAPAIQPPPAQIPV